MPTYSDPRLFMLCAWGADGRHDVGVIPSVARTHGWRTEAPEGESGGHAWSHHSLLLLTLSKWLMDRVDDPLVVRKGCFFSLTALNVSHHSEMFQQRDGSNLPSLSLAPPLSGWMAGIRTPSLCSLFKVPDALFFHPQFWRNTFILCAKVVSSHAGLLVTSGLQ